jgi:uncharacterized membrane protein
MADQNEQDQKMVIFVATYDDKAKADQDYKSLLDLHKEGWLGTYDVGVVAKSDKGKLDIVRHSDSTGKGARDGAVIGAVLGLLFPPAIVASTVAGGLIGTAVGHSLNDIPRHDLKEIGDMIENGQCAMVVLGQLQIEEGLHKATKRAIKEYQREFNVDVADYNRQLDAAIKAA